MLLMIPKGYQQAAPGAMPGGGLKVTPGPFRDAQDAAAGFAELQAQSAQRKRG